MAGARHLFGTVQSRVQGLLESGTLSTPPIWFDVVKRFPPNNPTVNRPAEPGRPEKITYFADKVRSEARGAVDGFTQEPLNLLGSAVENAHVPLFSNSLTEKYVSKYSAMLSQGVDGARALAICKSWFENEVEFYRRGKVTIIASENDETVPVEGIEPKSEDIFSLLKVSPCPDGSSSGQEN